MARRPLLDSAKEYARGMAGGLLFSLPLLYTMEVWWTGVMVDPFRLLAYVLAGFALLLGYNYYAGIHKDVTFMGQVMDTVEELGLGMMVAALVLWLLGRLTPEMGLREVIGQVVVEAVVVAIGISVGKKQLGGGGGKQDQGKQDQGKQGGGREPSVGGQLVIGLCGAVLISSNVAPTEEITIYFADRAPVGPYRVIVPVRRIRHVRFNELSDPAPIPEDTDYASVITSDVPIVVQHSRPDSRQAENALLSTIAFAA